MKVPKQVASGRALVWEDLDYSALIPLIRLQLDDVTVEFYDEHELLPNALVATGELNASMTLGYNCGKDVSLTFDMKDRKGSAKGTVVKVGTANRHSFSRDTSSRTAHAS